MTVTAIVPTFNRATVLPRALDSIFEQTVAVDEVIVVDDGSTDDTRELIAERYPTVRYLFQDNRGVSAARNAAIRAARGDWIALLDSDDRWLPTKIERQLDSLSAAPGLRLCHTDEIWIRRGRRVNQRKKHEKAGGDVFERCLPLCAISPSSAMIHRDLLRDVGLFDESLPVCEDYDLWLRITCRHQVVYVDVPLIEKYGGHDDQLSRSEWGIDRFRVRALVGLIRSAPLGPGQREATLSMLRDKVAILASGARKRGKESEALGYERQLAEFDATP